MENKEPRTFQDVRVFAGDNFYPAADASYRHLVWENIGLSGAVKRNSEIGTIPSWGPQFRVSFDLKINSLAPGDWASIIAFKKDGGARNNGEIGDRIPAIFSITEMESCMSVVLSVKIGIMFSISISI